MNNFLINTLLFSGLTVCLIAAIIILLPIVVLAGVLVMAMLPALFVGAVLVLMAGFIDTGEEYSYYKDSRKNKQNDSVSVGLKL